MKYITTCSIAFALLLACTAKKSAEIIDASPPKSWQSLETAEYVLTFPAEWTPQRNIIGADVCLLAPLDDVNAPFRENVNVVIEQLNESIRHDRYASLIQSKLANKYKTTAARRLIANGKEFSQNVFSDNADFILIQNYFAKDKKMYILTFTHPKNARQDVINTGVLIINSFSIK
jgi:hypothetical protein